MNFHGNNTRRCQPIGYFRWCCLGYYLDFEVFHSLVFLLVIYEFASLVGQGKMGGCGGTAMLGGILHPGTRTLVMVATHWESEAVSFPSDKVTMDFKVSE